MLCTNVLILMWNNGNCILCDTHFYLKLTFFLFSKPKHAPCFPPSIFPVLSAWSQGLPAHSPWFCQVDLHCVSEFVCSLAVCQSLAEHVLFAFFVGHLIYEAVPRGFKTNLYKHNHNCNDKARRCIKHVQKVGDSVVLNIKH